MLRQWERSGWVRGLKQKLFRPANVYFWQTDESSASLFKRGRAVNVASTSTESEFVRSFNTGRVSSEYDIVFIVQLPNNALAAERR